MEFWCHFCLPDQGAEQTVELSMTQLVKTPICCHFFICLINKWVNCWCYMMNIHGHLSTEVGTPFFLYIWAPVTHICVYELSCHQFKQMFAEWFAELYSLEQTTKGLNLNWHENKCIWNCGLKIAAILFEFQCFNKMDIHLFNIFPSCPEHPPQAFSWLKLIFSLTDPC